MITVKDKVNKMTGKFKRLVHDDVNVIIKIDGTDKSTTWTMSKVKEYKNDVDMKTDIAKLGLVEMDDYQLDDKSKKIKE
jgi:hypothetical protein